MLNRTFSTHQVEVQVVEVVKVGEVGEVVEVVLDSPGGGAGC